MANSSATDHNCKFVNNTVFMFQIVNDVKSVPFAPILYKNFHVHPQSNQKTTIFGKLCEIRQPFSVSHIGKWKLQNLQRIAQNSHNSPALCKNHVKFVQSMPISQDSLPHVVKLSKFATFVHLAILANFVQSAQLEINPGWSELSNICTICYYF